MPNKGELIKSTDLSSYLTADTVMDALDIETLKEALDVGSPKLVGNLFLDSYSIGGNYGTLPTMSKTLPTTDFDYLEVTSYAMLNSYMHTSESSTLGPEPSIYLPPITTLVYKNTSSIYIPAYYCYGSSLANASISRTLLTISGSTLSIKCASYFADGNTATYVADTWQYKDKCYFYINLYKY